MRKLLVITAALLFAGIAFGQSIKKGNAIGIEHITVTLNEGFTMDQYLEILINEYVPEFEKHYKGVKSILMIGDRGENVNQIGFMSIFESIEARNKYWPEIAKSS